MTSRIKQSHETIYPIETAYIRYDVASGTNGGATTAGSYQARPVNTLYNPRSFGWITSPSSNIWTMAAGRYLISGAAVVHRGASVRHRLYSITGAQSIATSINAYGNPADDVSSLSILDDEFVLLANSQIQLQYHVQISTTAQDLGVPKTNGEIERYVNLKFQRIGDV